MVLCCYMLLYLIKSGLMWLKVIESGSKWFYVATSGLICMHIPHTSLHPW